jgi:hypothetical protein
MLLMDDDFRMGALPVMPKFHEGNLPSPDRHNTYQRSVKKATVFPGNGQ